MVTRAKEYVRKHHSWEGERKSYQQLVLGLQWAQGAAGPAGMGWTGMDWAELGVSRALCTNPATPALQSWTFPGHSQVCSPAQAQLPGKVLPLGQPSPAGQERPFHWHPWAQPGTVTPEPGELCALTWALHPPEQLLQPSSPEPELCPDLAQVPELGFGTKTTSCFATSIGTSVIYLFIKRFMGPVKRDVEYFQFTVCFGAVCSHLWLFRMDFNTMQQACLKVRLISAQSPR